MTPNNKRLGNDGGKTNNGAQKRPAGNNGKYPFAMTPKALAVYIFFIIIVGLYLFFIVGNLAGKICACVVCPIMIIYLINAYRKEKKADENAWKQNNQIMDAGYFESAAWHENYVKYAYEHPFERPTNNSMKTDLLKRFQRKEYMAGMLLMFFLMFCSGCGIPMKKYAITVIGLCLFGLLFYMELALFIGMPVRKWLKSDINYNELESSYLSSQMLLY